MEDISTAYQLLIIITLVALNGFFVATEFALVSVRKSRVEELVSLGNKRAKHLQTILGNLDRYIAGTQVGITLASLAIGWLGEPLIAHNIESLFDLLGIAWFSPVVVHSIAFGLAFLAITVLHVVLGELVPKSLALQRSESVALIVSRPMALVVVVLHPLIWALNGIGNRILRLLGLDPSEGHHNVYSVDELQILVQQSHEAGIFDDTERAVLQRSFRFAELTAKDIMVRRIDIIALDLEEPRQDLIDKAATSRHSRLPVYIKSLDHIVGILFIQDLCRAYHKEAIPESIRDLCRPVLAVPEGIHLDDLLDFFRTHHTHIAVVVDEHGGTAGIVTFEDLVEEVTGEIQNEFQSTEVFPQQLPDGRIILRGDMRIEDVSSHLHWTLSSDDVDTLAGFIMSRLGRVARVDDKVETEFGTFQVIDMARMRITKVSARPTKSEAVGQN